MRVNYPIKHALVEMDNSRTIDMENEIHKFCVSSVTCLVAGFGLEKVVKSWNEHPIPGKQIHVFFIRTSKLNEAFGCS